MSFPGLGQGSSMNMEGGYGGGADGGSLTFDYSTLGSDDGSLDILLQLQAAEQSMGGSMGLGGIHDPTFGRWQQETTTSGMGQGSSSAEDNWAAIASEPSTLAMVAQMPGLYTIDRQKVELPSTTTDNGGRCRLSSSSSDMFIDSPRASFLRATIPPASGTSSHLPQSNNNLWPPIAPVPKWSNDPGNLPLPDGHVINSFLRNSPNLFKTNVEPQTSGIGQEAASSALPSMASFKQFSDSFLGRHTMLGGGLEGGAGPSQNAGPPDAAMLDRSGSGKIESFSDGLQQHDTSGGLQRRRSDSQLYVIGQQQLTRLLEDLPNIVRLPPKKPASHSVAERKRRDRINERFNILREVVPGCTKADKATVLMEVIEYVKKLQVQARMADDKHNNNNNNASSTATNLSPNTGSLDQPRSAQHWRDVQNPPSDNTVATSEDLNTVDGEAANFMEDDVSVSGREGQEEGFVIKVCCPDRKGLLCSLSESLRDMSFNIVEAEVLTIGSRAMGTITVTPDGGPRIDADTIVAKLQAIAFRGSMRLLPLVKVKVEGDQFGGPSVVKREQEEKKRRISSDT